MFGLHLSFLRLLYLALLSSTTAFTPFSLPYYHKLAAACSAIPSPLSLVATQHSSASSSSSSSSSSRSRCSMCGFGRPPVALASSTPSAWTPVSVYEEHVVKTSKPGPPAQDVTVEDLTPAVNALVKRRGLWAGTVTVVSRHTTTAITINEWESRLVEDIRSWLLGLAPPDDRSAVPVPGGGISYLHNDIDERPDSEDERQRCVENGWDVSSVAGPRGLAAWRAQEPINAHSHLLSMLLGSSESIPVHEGRIVLGQWQVRVCKLLRQGSFL